MTIIEAYRKYTENGIAVHPTNADKTPMIPADWKQGFGESAFNGAYGIGVICGKISGGIECLDFDNHFFDAKERLVEFLSIPEVKEIYEKYKLPIEVSMRNGYHIAYRCSVVGANKKLAIRLNKETGKGEALIETRGEGGYFCAFPSPGYKVLRNDIFNIPVISPIERATLMDICCSYNEYTKDIILTEHEKPTGDRVGDLYNESSQAITDMISLLEQEGWKQISKYGWRRPNKTSGISATLGKLAPNIFFPFSSNSDPFDEGKPYTPFQVLAILKFNKDFKEAAKSLVPEFGQQQTPQLNGHAKLDTTEIEKLLERSKIDTKREVKRPPVILSIVEKSATQSIYKRLFTLGNFSCIIGKAKSRKTYLLSMLTASIINPNCNEKFRSELPTNKSGVLYFDTEQGEYDCYNVIKRIETISSVGTMRSFSLREFSPMERCTIIEHAFKLWGKEVGYCVIDGIADLAMAINDEVEATRITTMLLRLTKQYNCHISTVIHQNKNDNFATGHLGSSIMKKAEILISVTKANSNPQISDVTCDLSRSVDFEPFCMMIDDSGLPFISGVPKNEKSKNPYQVKPEIAVGLTPIAELTPENNDCPF